jgi:hypothetical protein
MTIEVSRRWLPADLGRRSKARTITVYPRGGGIAIFSGDDELTAEPMPEPMPGFSCKVSDFFPAPIRQKATR